MQKRDRIFSRSFPPPPRTCTLCLLSREHHRRTYIHMAAACILPHPIFACSSVLQSSNISSYRDDTRDDAPTLFTPGATNRTRATCPTAHCSIALSTDTLRTRRSCGKLLAPSRDTLPGIRHVCDPQTVLRLGMATAEGARGGGRSGGACSVPFIRRR